MKQIISSLALLVRDYDEAITYYTEKIGFKLAANTDLGESKRWVLLSPPGAAECHILLARADTAEQRSRIGNQTGGRVFLILETDNFERDHAAMQASGVEFLEEPRHEPYGTVAVFRDLYGNKWDLLEPGELSSARS